MSTPALIEPNLHMYPSLAQLPQTEPTVNSPPTAALLPPNDASIILLLAAEAKRDHELEAELQKSTAKSRPFAGAWAGTSDPVNRLILRFHQQLQKEHGFPEDATIHDEGRRAYWSSVEKTWGVRFTESYIARKTLELLYASQRSDLDSKPFHFFRLPLEIREKVYRYALGGECRRIVLSSLDRIVLSSPDREILDDYSKHLIHGAALLHGDKCHPHLQKSCFRVRSARVGCGKGINTAILRSSRALHEEAEPFLYQLHEFDFSVDVFGVVSFLRSVSHNARQNISCLTMYLNMYLNEDIADSPHSSELKATSRFNLLHWGLTCSYVAQNVRLRELAFELSEEASDNFRHLSWVQDMAQIKGLRKLTFYEYTVGSCHWWCENSGPEHKNRQACEKLGREDKDRTTTGISVRNRALLAYLESEMLASANTRI